MRYLLLFVFSFLVSCAQLPVKSPTASISSANISNISFDAITFDVVVDINNPNRVSFPESMIALSLGVAKEAVATATAQSEKLAAQGITRVRVPVTLPFSALYAAKSDLKGANQFDYAIAGGMTVTLPIFGAVEFPLSFKGVAPIPQMPKVSLDNVAIAKLGLTETVMNLELAIENNNIFAMDFADLALNVDLNQQALLSAKPEQKLHIGAENKQTMQIPVTLNNAELGRSLLQMLTSKKPGQWAITGTGKLNALNGLPLDGFSFSDLKQLSAQ